MSNICFVHAHPDDETLATGALIGHLVADGHSIHVLTATRGEMGEVIPGPLSYLAGTPELEAKRGEELAGALSVLGVQAHAYLGTPPARANSKEPRRYLDSGMVWVAEGVAGPTPDSDERSLCAADESEVVADIKAWLTNAAADLVISYDDDGGYGHPDHVRCHHAAKAAARELGLDFAVIVHESGAGVTWFDLEELEPLVVSALQHHQTQLSVSDGVVTHSGGQREPVRTSVGLRGALRAITGSR